MDNAAGRGYGEEPPATSRRRTLCLGIFLVCPASAGVQRHPITVLRESFPRALSEKSQRSPCALLMSSSEFLVAHLELKGWQLSCREAMHLAMVNKFQSYSCERALQSCTSAMGGAARLSPPAGCVWGCQRRGWHFCRIRSCAIGSCNSPLLDRRLWEAHPNSETDGLREDSRAVWVTTHGDEASDCHPERARFGPFASVKLRNSSACHRQGVPGRDSSERLRIRCGGVNAPQG